MAQLNTRLQLKIDSFENWNKWYTIAADDTALETAPDFTAADFDFSPYANKGAALVLNRGEVAFCEIPSGSAEATTAPTVLFKVGDGTHHFCELEWASALAADVHAWAKKSDTDFLTWMKSTNKFLVDTDLSDINNKLLLLDTVDKSNNAISVTAAITAAKSELVGESTDTDTTNTITGAKKYADKKITDLLNAYILDETGNPNNDTIDKLQEIAAWIADDAAGAAKIVKDLANKLDSSTFETFQTSRFDPVAAKAHTHTYTATDTEIQGAVDKAHAHTYTATDADIQDAVDRKHSHAAGALDVTSAEKAAWNAKLDKSVYDAEKVSFIKDNDTLVIDCGTSTTVI